jgi:hypothetical protein
MKIGEPPEEGSLHEITTFSPTRVEIGASGLLGSYAAKIDTDSDFIL